MIRIGVAGWDYPDWRGTVYPPRAGASFDRLAFLARFVDAVEVNSTFYRPVDPRVSSSWVRRTEAAPGFRFTAKAHRSWTHQSDSEPREVVAPTLAGLEPLRSADALGAILVQFPQRFHAGPEALDRIGRLNDLLDGWPVVVEVRHSSWESDDAVGWLRERRIGWCVVDQPRVGRSTLSPLPRVTSSVGYLRLHGRNVSNWFREGAGRDARYDYLYGLDELRPLAGAAREMDGQAKELFVIQNNHFRGQALVNALQMKHLVEGKRPAAPDSLIRAYPRIAEEVRGDQESLF
jgi:uncharacterized protein YecE (DUF72 family)